MAPTQMPKGPSSPPKPTSVVAPLGATVFEICWQDGTVHKLPNEILRGFCPCAACQGHGAEIRFQKGHNAELRDIRTVGNYALGLGWGDAHDSGIYTFDYLYALGALHAKLGSEGLIELEVLPRGSVVAAGGASPE